MQKPFVKVVVYGFLTIMLAMCWSDLSSAALRNGRKVPWRTWPKGQIFYRISNGFDATQIANIKKAMAAIEAVSCVRFRVAKPNRKIFVNITTNGIGCNAPVGYKPRVQKFSMSITMPKCFHVPVIMHELMHIVGFFHQHIAADRDNFVQIMWQNIQPEKRGLFRKLAKGTPMHFGFGYDYDSIMQYNPKAYSVNGLDTIVPLVRGVKIGQRNGLSEKDIRKINAMYKCSK